MMNFAHPAIIRDLVSLTYRDVVRRRLMTPFVIFIAFLLSFTASRLVAYLFPMANFIIGDYHIHHFYFGIVMVIASNWISLVSNRERPMLFAAALFGIGLGFIADETGLLLTCTSPLTLECDYNARITLDIFIFIVGLFLSILYLLPVWRRLRRMALHTIRPFVGP